MKLYDPTDIRCVGIWTDKCLVTTQAVKKTITKLDYRYCSWMMANRFSMCNKEYCIWKIWIMIITALACETPSVGHLLHFFDFNKTTSHLMHVCRFLSLYQQYSVSIELSNITCHLLTLYNYNIKMWAYFLCI